MKKFTVTFVILFSLFVAGCGSDSADEIQEARLFKTDAFSLLPADVWVPVQKEDFSARMPAQSLVGFTRVNEASDIQSTFTVVEELLPESVENAESYANANIGQAMQHIINYQTVVIEELTIGDQKTKKHVFRGKVEKDDNISLFIQTYLVKNKKGYILTGVLLENADEITQQEVQSMIQSFSFVSE